MGTHPNLEGVCFSGVSNCRPHHYSSIDREDVHRSEGCLGQGMIEYLLVLSIVVGTVVGTMTMLTNSTSAVINCLITNVQAITG